jgi:hypothetical protein
MKGSAKGYKQAKALAEKMVKAPWEKKGPAGPSRKLTAGQLASAKRSAQKAGRPYPNLVDNMRAAKKGKR